MLTDAKREFIEFMMSCDVLRFGDFVTKSGRRTPYFVNEVCGDGFDAMFGPAYKGIPLVTTTSASLARNYGLDKPFFFNRKEEKDHGEGGSLVGYKPKDGDKVIIIEDVITAGTAVRETMPVLTGAAKVEVPHLFMSVFRCVVG